MAACKPRENPFRVQQIDALPYHYHGTTHEALISRLEQLRFRGALIGEKGRGKSTLLRDLGAQLEADGWTIQSLRLHTSHRNFSSTQWHELSMAGARDFILLDGAEQLNALRWHWFLRCTRRSGGLLVTSHHAGLLPTLHECSTSPQLLHQLVMEIINNADISLTDWNELVNWSEDTARILLLRHKGNLRDAMRELYDSFPLAPLER